MVSPQNIAAVMRRLIDKAVAPLRRLSVDRSAMGAVEFAILLPIMIVTYIGVVEITDGFTIKRKVDMAASALGDLVTRTSTISTAEMNNILDAAEAVIAPYNSDNLKAKLTCVVIADDEMTVAWGVARNDTAHEKDTTVTLPGGVALPDSKVVVAEVHYAYTPAIGYVLTRTLDLAGLFYLKPRDDNKVCYNGDCC